eukprot:TRINITY_DN4729_c0_g1_i1.p1 TRINITY_DN4729_c0_g1~~TRINITY_DN4729_c0_g1_i1.p1  ORF type:complete len:178 (+),score=24.37 TRINITY_DN4729_c0_g1_i1:451-984(+)
MVAGLDQAKGMPAPITAQLFEVTLGCFDKLEHKMMNRIYTQCLNKRLGRDPTGKEYNLASFTDTMLEAERQGKNLDMLFRVPEDDSWLYEGHICRVCSSYVFEVLRHGGLFPGVTFNAAEQAPGDLIRVRIYDSDPSHLPEKCRLTDPGLPFGQVLGKYRLTIPDFNSTPARDHMNE